MRDCDIAAIQAVNAACDDWKCIPAVEKVCDRYAGEASRTRLGNW